ncbi:MAG: hypothetical protein IPN29_02205 [Saprospiraceae bacterium]|nr:hypothetical protein [Saprospiraceae bacterium]
MSDKEFMINLFRLNEEKELPGNETKALIRRQFKKAGLETKCEELLNNPKDFYQLWHILYSLENEIYIKSALHRQFNITEDQAEIISKAPPSSNNTAHFLIRR